VSAKQFTEDLELSRQVLSLTVAATLPKIQPENVKIVSVREIVNETYQDSTPVRVQQESNLACNVSYIIGFETDDFATSQKSLRVFSLELLAAVLSGDFGLKILLLFYVIGSALILPLFLDNTMQRIAKRLHSIPLRNIATVNVFVAPSLKYSSTESSSSVKDPLPKSSFFAQILVGSLLLLFIGVVAFFFRKPIKSTAQSLYQQLTSSYSEVPLSSDSQHPGNMEAYKSLGNDGEGDIHNPVHSSNSNSPDDDSAVEMSVLKSSVQSNGVYSKV